MKLPCTIMRGGSSKAVLLREGDLPHAGKARDAMILSVFGSPDRRQIDGLGGADPLTSKLAIIGPPTHARADIDYTFAQVGIETAYVDYGGYCGNVLAAVAVYAVDEGFVPASGNHAKVLVHVVNTGRIVAAEVPLSDGRAAETGGAEIAGVPGTGAPIRLDFGGTIGSLTGRVLPTGNAVDVVDVPGFGTTEASVIDAGNPMIFLRLEAFGLQPDDGPDEIDPREDIIGMAERIRLHVARQFGLTMPDGSVSEHIPLLAVVGSPADYVSYSSRSLVPASAVDFVSREFFAGRIHKAYGVGETICSAAAALIPGTIVNSAAGCPSFASRTVRIGHPSGCISASVGILNGDIVSIQVERTARRIMDGFDISRNEADPSRQPVSNAGE